MGDRGGLAISGRMLDGCPRRSRDHATWLASAESGIGQRQFARLWELS